MNTRERNAIISSLRQSYIDQKEVYVTQQLGMPYILGKLMENVESLKQCPNRPESAEVMSLRFIDIAQWAILGIDSAKKLQMVDNPREGGSERTTRDYKDR